MQFSILRVPISECLLALLVIYYEIYCCIFMNVLFFLFFFKICSKTEIYWVADVASWITAHFTWRSLTPAHVHSCLYAARLLHRYYSGTYLRAFWSSEFLYYFYPVTLVMWMLDKVGSEGASLELHPVLVMSMILKLCLYFDSSDLILSCLNSSFIQYGLVMGIDEVKESCWRPPISKAYPLGNCYSEWKSFLPLDHGQNSNLCA